MTDEEFYEQGHDFAHLMKKGEKWSDTVERLFSGMDYVYSLSKFKKERKRKPTDDEGWIDNQLKYSFLDSLSKEDQYRVKRWFVNEILEYDMNYGRFEPTKGGNSVEADEFFRRKIDGLHVELLRRGLYEEAGYVDNLHLKLDVEDLSFDETEDKSKTNSYEDGFDGKRRLSDTRFLMEVVRPSRARELRAMKLCTDDMCEELAKRVEDVMKIDLADVFIV